MTYQENVPHQLTKVLNNNNSGFSVVNGFKELPYLKQYSQEFFF